MTLFADTIIGLSVIRPRMGDRSRQPSVRGAVAGSLPAYFSAGRGIGVTPTCSSAVYGAP
jgi:hypothetical protein